MIITSGENTPSAMKATIQQHIAQLRNLSTDIELSSIYRTSGIAKACAEFWADNVAAVKFRLHDPAGNPVDHQKTPHALAELLASPNFYDVMRKSELTMRFWGWTVSRKERNVYGRTRGLSWINPYLVRQDKSTSEGLKGFRISPGRYQPQDVGYIELNDALFFNEFDFTDEYNGVSSAETAALDAATDPEIAQTLLATYRNMAIPAAIVQPKEGSEKKNESELSALRAFLQARIQGAINTARTLVTPARWEWIQLQMPFKEIDFRGQRQDLRESIAISFHLSPAFISLGQTTYAELEGHIQIWVQQRFSPRCTQYGHALTAQLCNEYPGYTIKPDLSDFIKEDESALVDIVTRKQNAMLVTIYEAQKSLSDKPDEAMEGMYLIDGTPVHRDDLRNYWKIKTGIAINTPTTETQLPVAPAPANQLPATVDTTKDADAPSLFVALSLKNNPDLIGLQNQLKAMCEKAGVGGEWSSPEEFHITLLYAPSVDDALAQPFLEAIQEILVPELSLKMGSVDTFNNVGEHALHFRVRRNPVLLEYQAQLHELATEYGIPLSSYSSPDQYKPHVTMGYIDQKLSPVVFQGKFSIAPDSVIINRDDEEVWRSGQPDIIEGVATKTVHEIHVPRPVYREIEVATGKAFKSVAFTPEHLPEATAVYIQTLAGYGFEPDVIVKAAKSHYVGVSAAKAIGQTEDLFKRQFADELDVARNDEVSKRRYGNIVQKLVDRFIEMAYDDGLVDGGVDLAEKSEDDRQSIQDLQSEQRTYIGSFKDTLFEDGITDAQASLKAEQWWNRSVKPAYFKGLLSASKNAMVRWGANPQKEHCRTCRALDGQIHRLGDFMKYNFYPNSGALECGVGGLCGCNVVPVPGQKAYGRLAAVPYVRGRKSHHDHEENEVSHE